MTSSEKNQALPASTHCCADGDGGAGGEGRDVICPAVQFCAGTRGALDFLSQQHGLCASHGNVLDRCWVCVSACAHEEEGV